MWWKSKERKDIVKGHGKGDWIRCPKCEEIQPIEGIEESHGLCFRCEYAFSIPALGWADLVTDLQSFEKIKVPKEVSHSRYYKKNKDYQKALKRAMKETGLEEAVVLGRATINERAVVVGVIAEEFLDGRLGLVSIEMLKRGIIAAEQKRYPFLLCFAGGALREEEGIGASFALFSLLSLRDRLIQAQTPLILYFVGKKNDSLAKALRADLYLADYGAELLADFEGIRRIKRSTLKFEISEIIEALSKA